MEAPLNKKNLFQRYIIPYVILIFIIFMPQMYLFMRFSSSLEKSHREKWHELSARKGEQVDSKLEEIDNIMSQVLLDPDFRYAAFSENGNTGLLYQYSQSLPHYSSINESLIDLVIYLFENELFLKPGAFSLKPISFFQSLIDRDASQYPPWLRQVGEGSGRSRFLKAREFDVDAFGGTGEILTFIRDFPISTSSPKGFILSLISVRELLDDTIGDFLNNELNYIIYNDSGVLASTNTIGLEQIEYISRQDDYSSIEVNGTVYHIYNRNSRFPGLRYASLIPDSLLMKQIYQLRNLSIFLFGFFLLLGGFVSVLFALKTARPVGRIYSLLESHESREALLGKAGSFEEIFHSIESLIDNNSRLRINLKQHKQDLGKSFLSQLINGDMGDENRLKTYLDYIELPIGCGSYLLAIGKLSGFSMDLPGKEVVEELEQKKLVLKTILEEAFEKNLQIQNLHSDKILLLFHNQSSEGCSTIGGRLKGIAETLDRDLKVQVQFAVGPEFANLIDTHIYYRRVITIFNNPVPSEVPVFYLESSPPDSRFWSYDLETELQLIALIRMGDREKALALIATLKEENRGIGRKRNLVYLSELSGTIFKLAYQMLQGEELSSFETALYDIRQSEHISEYYSGLEEKISYLCEYTDSRKESHNTELRDSVFRYIEEHYADFDINLYKVSSQFNIAEKYLSRFFKDQAGSNFAGYIEDLRMKKAVLLMTDTTYSLSLISEKVGYSNHNTFYKAFKRKFSMSPGVYRDKIRQK